MQQLWGRAGAVVSTCMQGWIEEHAIRRNHREGAVVSTCMQRLGGRVGSRSMHSDAIICNQTQSYAITCNQMPSRGAGTQTQSDAIRCHHVPSTCFTCHQMPPDTLCASHLCHAHKAHPACHVQSDAIRCTQISPVPCAQSPSRMPCATASSRRPGPSG